MISIIRVHSCPFVVQMFSCFSWFLNSYFVDQNCLRRFRERFRHPYKELVERLLKEPHAINVEEAYNLFGRWDKEFGFDKRPKSDFVTRALLREFKWKPPKCK